MIYSHNVDNKIIQTDVLDIDFDSEYDVVIVGLGTAGAISALRAENLNLKVLGIETLHCMGGLGTVGGVNYYYFGSKGGFFQDVDTKVSQKQKDNYVSFVHPKEVILEDCNANLAYESKVIGIYLEDKKIVGLKWISNNKIANTKCKFLIDATGDAHICHLAGCETEFGRKTDGKMQPYTSVKGYFEDGRVKNTNHDSGNINQFEQNDYSKCIISSNAEWLEDDYTNKQLLYLSPIIGLREGRRIVGEANITLNDFFFKEPPLDIIFYANSDLDKHGYDNTLETEDFQDWYIASNLCAVNVCIPIPAGSLIPKGYDGILVCGRCLSVSRELATNVRMERDMQKSGEVAATLSYLAIKNNCQAKDVKYEQLKNILLETGCLDYKNDKGYHFAHPNEDWIKKITWYTAPNDIKDGLDSLKPGISIWSCNLLKSNIEDHLTIWLNSTSENLRKHSAIALGLINNKLALPILREMVINRDSQMLQDCRKKNQLRMHIAIYLLGKLKDECIVDELIDIINSEKEIEHTLYNNDANFYIGQQSKNYNNMFFQSFSHSVMSLIKIYETCDKNLAERIKTALLKSIENDTYIKNITSKSATSYEYSMAENLKLIITKNLSQVDFERINES